MKTVARVASELLEDPNLSDRTRHIYAEILQGFLNKHGFENIRDIGRSEIREFLSAWDGAKHKTYNLSHSVVNRLFSHALTHDYVEDNPVTKIARRKAHKARGETKQESVNYLSREQVRVLFHASRTNLRLLTLLHLLYDSGARIAEILSLDLKNVNLSQGEFHIIGKGNKERTCYFRPTTAALVRQYLNEGREQGIDALFTERMKRSARVRRLTYKKAYRDLTEISSDTTSIKGVTFHQLRHTFATERANTVPIESLKALLGHESITTTQIYQKVTSQAAKQSAFDAFAKLDTLEV